MYPRSIVSLIEREGLVAFRKTEPTYCNAAIFVDSAGSRLWSVNIVVGDEDETFLDGSVSFPYSASRRNTIFAVSPAA